MTSPVNPTVTYTAVASLFVDHSDLGLFNQAVNATSHLSAGARQAASQTFWSTPERAASSTIQETLEITLSSTRLINWVKLDTVVFPHTLVVQYWNAATNKWVPLLDKTRAPFTQQVMRSIPTQLPNPVSVPGHLHPQHSFLGHWRTIETTTLPTHLQRLRFVLQRYDNGLGPVDVLGSHVNYSLALRNIIIGYEVATRADVPRTLPTDPTDGTYGQPFASTDDLLGSLLSFSLRDPTADRILNNADDDADAIWLCEPQPFPSAVVCFYADIRDAKGGPRLVDQIFLNPVNSGAHVTVYWSNDIDTQDGFDSSTYPLNTSQVHEVGQVVLQDQRLQFGNYGDAAYLTIPNVPTDAQSQAQRGRAALGYDPSVPWWFGVIVRAGFDQGVDDVEHPIIDCGQWRLSLTVNGLTLTLNDFDPRDCPISYQGGQDVTAIVTYDGTGNFHIHASTDFDDQIADFWTQPFETGECPTVMLGTDLNTTYFSNCDLLGLVLKEELSDGTDDFLNSPYSYCTVAEFEADDLPQSRSAVLRLDPSSSLVSTVHPWALFGGPAVRYESLSWAPIPRDFIMARGWMYLPPTQARYLKLEITNLQAVPYDIAVSGPQEVKTFPQSVLNAYRQRLANSSSENTSVGLTAQMALSGTSPYADVPTFVSTGGNGLRGYTNTEVYISDDYTTGQRLRALQGENWGYQTYHVGTGAPRFANAQVHDYVEQTVTRTGKVAYQTGLRQIAFAYSSFTSQQDTGMYEETFYTSDNINIDTDQNNIVYDPDRDALYSGTTTDYARASSLIYPSLRDVRAVQYAVQQSPPSQLLPDDDFEDPSFANWQLLGDVDTPTDGVAYSSLLGSMLPISRSVTLGRWGDIRPVFGTYGGITALGLTYGDLRSKQTTSSAPQAFGGVQNLNPVTQPKGGRVYAASRVVAEADLVNPLHLQIVDSITNLTLADSATDVKADQVTEWYVGYDVGAGGTNRGTLWGDLSGAYLNNYPTFGDSFDRPDSATMDLMDSGQQWMVPTTSAGSLAIITNQAVCNGAGQASVVDTLTPWGTMSVQLGTSILTTTASASVPLFYLGYLRFMNDGRIVDTNTGRVLATVTGLADNDTFQFDFMPTSLVPSGSRPVGVDASVQSWALVVSHNGTALSPAVCSTRTWGTRRGLAGAVGQHFQSFGWVPRAAGIPTGQVIGSQPMPTDGAIDATGTVWTQNNGQTWSLQDIPAQNPAVPPTFGTGPVYLGSPNTISAPAFVATTPSVTTVSTTLGTSALGTLCFRITQLAATIDPSTYSVAVLDTPLGTTSLELQANGDLVRYVAGTKTTLKTGAIPSAAMTTGDIAVKYVLTSQLSAAFRTTWSIPGPDPVTGIYANLHTLIFLVNDAVRGVYFAPTIWNTASSTRVVRALYGYNDNAGHYTVTTGFGWSSDANAVSTGATGAGVTWGEVGNYNTRLWGDLSREVSVDLNPLYARVVQYDASADTWYQDTLSLFSDPIVWEFSNNGGKSWVPGWDVANNPEAAVAFNPKPTGQLTATANQLCYRVTIWAPDQWISHLAIRPWYLGFMRGVPSRPVGAFQGPNINPWDHYPPIEFDPRWRTWSNPIPREWWFAFHSPDLTQRYITPYVTDNVLVTGG